MIEFEIGDRVKLNKLAKFAYPDYVGERGKIVNVFQSSTYPFEVKLDIYTYDIDNIQLKATEMDLLSKTNKYIRPSFDEYFMSIAEETGKRSTCLRKQVGTVIVKDNKIVSTGYNGSIKGDQHCIEHGCLLNEEGRCIRTIHSETNAIIFADRHLLEGSTVYTTLFPCENCSKLLTQVGISKLIYKNDYKNEKSLPFLKNMEVIKFKE